MYEDEEFKVAKRVRASNNKQLRERKREGERATYRLLIA